MIMTRQKARAIWEQYNRGKSIQDLAKQEGVKSRAIQQAVQEYTDTLIHNFRERPKEERDQHNENQRIMLATEIGERTPELCGHGDRDHTPEGEVCRYCNLNFDKPLNMQNGNF